MRLCFAGKLAPHIEQIALTVPEPSSHEGAVNSDAIDEPPTGELLERDASGPQVSHFRLNVVPISIPPLRERRDDIPLLTNHFLNKFNMAFNKRIPGFAKKSLAVLSRYHWPGNIRELENLVERIVVLATEDESIDIKDIPLEVLLNSEEEPQESDYQKSGLIKIRGEFEKRCLFNVLEAVQGNQSEAAKILKINRNTLIQKARQFGILLKKEPEK